MKRILVLVVGLACGGTASQAPEFTQQYLQRLGGWRDSYVDLVARLDSRAAEFGLSRDQYIAALRRSEDPKVLREAEEIARWPAYERELSKAYAAINDAPPLMRAIRMLEHFNRPVAEAAWDGFRPAMQLTTEGLAYGGAGFLMGWILTGLLGVPAQMVRRGRAERSA